MFGQKVMGVLSLLVMFLGVMVSVRLVDMNQDIRRGAAPKEGIEICHKTGSVDNPFNLIKISENAIETHLKHGDTVGSCSGNSEASSDNNSSGDDNDNQNNNSQNNSNNSGGNQSDNSSNNSSNNSSSGNNQNNENNPQSDNSNNNSNDSSNTSPQPEADQPLAETATPTPNSFIYKLRLQGVGTAKYAVSLKISFIQNGQIKYVRNSTARYDQSGAFSNTIWGIPLGEYQVFIKTSHHLGMLFTEVNIETGISTWDWTASTLLVGDFNNDNVFDVKDIGLFLAEYDRTDVTVNSTNTIYDINHDGLLNLLDLKILLGNYSDFYRQGEEILL